VPAGTSYWEVGTALRAREKASKDYDDCTQAVLAPARIESTFIFVTPLSGRRGFPHTWTRNGQASWIDEKRQRCEWKDVRILDGTNLVDWMSHFPSVQRRLARQMNLLAEGFTTPELHWAELRRTGEPPPLFSEVFLASRDEACKAMPGVGEMRIAVRYEVTSVSGDTRTALLKPICAMTFTKGAGATTTVELQTSSVDGWILFDVEKG